MQHTFISPSADSVHLIESVVLHGDLPIPVTGQWIRVDQPRGLVAVCVRDVVLEYHNSRTPSAPSAEPTCNVLVEVEWDGSYDA